MKKMVLFTAMVAVFFILVLSGCPSAGDAPKVKVQGVSINTPADIYFPAADNKPDTIYLGLKFSPANASNKEVLWEQDKNEFISVNPFSGVVTAKKVGGPTMVSVVTVDGGRTAEIPITVLTSAGEGPQPPTPQDGVIWQFTKGDVTFSNASTARVINGVPAVRTGGVFAATAEEGIVMSTGGNSSRFVLGVSAVPSGEATTGSKYYTGALNLNCKFSVTVTYTAETAGSNLMIYLQNTTTTANSSIFGSASLKQETTGTSGTITLTFDAPNLTASSVTAAQKEEALNNAILQIRYGGTTKFVISSIVIQAAP